MSEVNLILGNDLARKLVYPEVHVVDNPLESSPTQELDQTATHVLPACAVIGSKTASMKTDSSGNLLDVDQFISHAITKKNLIQPQQCDPSLIRCRKVAHDSLDIKKKSHVYYNESISLSSSNCLRVMVRGAPNYITQFC